MFDVQRSLGNTEDECSQLKESCEASQKELQLLAEKYDDRRKEVKELQEKLQVSPEFRLSDLNRDY